MQSQNQKYYVTFDINHPVRDIILDLGFDPFSQEGIDGLKAYILERFIGNVQVVIHSMLPILPSPEGNGPADDTAPETTPAPAAAPVAETPAAG